MCTVTYNILDTLDFVFNDVVEIPVVLKSLKFYWIIVIFSSNI